MEMMNLNVNWDAEDTFRSNERIMLKFVEPMTWFLELRLKDLFKNKWKVWLTRLTLVSEINGDRTKFIEREITTATFIPTTPGSELLKRKRDEDDRISQGMDWGIKFMENSGTPLINLFMNNFGIQQGCPRNSMETVKMRHQKCCVHG